MKVTAGPLTAATLRRYATIPAAFQVRRMLAFALQEGDAAGFALREVAVARPYVKDYDALEAGGPEAWLGKLAGDKTAVFLAEAHTVCLGGAVVAFDTPHLISLPASPALAVLWDIRVRPDARDRGLGSRLFAAAAAWAASQGCAQLVAETQNTNVVACRFYARQGCELRLLDRFAYAADPQVAGEIMLIWQKRLVPTRTAGD